MHPKGPVWNHFKESGDSVVCNHCNKNYNKATAKSSTNPLWYHLKEQQDDDDEEEVDDNDASIPSLEEPLRLREALPELAGDIAPVIKKVRKIVSKFRRSPVKNDLLLKEVALTFDKELTLLRFLKINGR